MHRQTDGQRKCEVREARKLKNEKENEDNKVEHSH
jgi:hypothetical protein